MKADLKAKWLEALRSGKYEQGSGVLRDNADRFCCLGVLCDLAGPFGWGKARLVNTCVNQNDTEVDARPYEYADEVAETTLPYPLQKLTGMTQSQITELIRLNDSGNDFEFIAKHIEQNISVDALL